MDGVVGNTHSDQAGSQQLCVFPSTPGVIGKSRRMNSMASGSRDDPSSDDDDDEILMDIEISDDGEDFVPGKHVSSGSGLVQESVQRRADPCTQNSTQPSGTNTSQISKNKSYQRHPKPPFSYIALIAMAMRDSPNQRLTLSEINEYLMEKFEFFRGTYTGWKNSIRHNLSLNECFTKILRDPTRPWGKDNYWTLNANSEYTFADGVFRRRRRRLVKRPPEGTSSGSMHFQVPRQPQMMMFQNPHSAFLDFHRGCDTVGLGVGLRSGLFRPPHNRTYAGEYVKPDEGGKFSSPFSIESLLRANADHQPLTHTGGNYRSGKKPKDSTTPGGNSNLIKRPRPIIPVPYPALPFNYNFSATSFEASRSLLMSDCSNQIRGNSSTLNQRIPDQRMLYTYGLYHPGLVASPFWNPGSWSQNATSLYSKCYQEWLKQYMELIQKSGRDVTAPETDMRHPDPDDRGDEEFN
jgi:hypothetical protein